MSKEVIVNTAATIYIAAGSGSPRGPCARCARIVTPEAVYELAGASGDVHFSALYTVGSIAALDALPESSKVHVVCADSGALGRFQIAEGVTLGRNRKKWKDRPKVILDLCPQLHKAMLRHTEVTTQVVPMAKANEEQLEASRRVAQVIGEFIGEADFGMTRPDRAKLRLVSRSEGHTEAIGLKVEKPSLRDAERPTTILAPDLDVPW